MGILCGGKTMRGHPHETENSKAVGVEDKNSSGGRGDVSTRPTGAGRPCAGWRQAPAKTPRRQLAPPGPHAGIALIILDIS